MIVLLLCTYFSMKNGIRYSAFHIMSISEPYISYVRKPKKTILTVFDEYIELCISQNLSQSVMCYKDRLYNELKRNGMKYLDEIDQKLLNEIVNKYQKDTANHYIKNLKAFLNFCIKKRYYDRSDLENLE